MLLTRLNYITAINVLDYLDCESLSNLAKYSKFIFDNYKDYIYYRHATDNKLLDNLDYFVKDAFSVPVFNSSTLNDLLYYISKEKTLFIAGGLPTQIYMGLTPKETSDIDIYFLGGMIYTYTDNDKHFYANYLNELYYFLEFIRRSYSDVRVQNTGTNVYTIRVSEIIHPIQIIVTTHSTPAQVLSSFDNSHNRCGIYMNNTYVGIDTVLSHSTMTTYFYTSAVPSRYIKALDLNFNIFGLNDEELGNIVQDLNVSEPGKITKGIIPDQIIFQIRKYANPHNNWKNGYNSQKTINHFTRLEVDISKPLSCGVKSAVYNGVEFRDYPKLRTAILPIRILKSPNSAFLKIKMPTHHTYKYTIIGKVIHRINSYVEVENPLEMEKLKVVRKNMLEIFMKHHKVKELPDMISNCRALTTWDEFLKYRELIGNPVTDTNIVESGFEYDDCMRMYDNYIFIKGFLPNHLNLLYIPEGMYYLEIQVTPLLKNYCNAEFSHLDNMPFSWGFYEHRIINNIPFTH